MLIPYDTFKSTLPTCYLDFYEDYLGWVVVIKNVTWGRCSLLEASNQIGNAPWWNKVESPNKGLLLKFIIPDSNSATPIFQKATNILMVEPERRIRPTGLEGDPWYYFATQPETRITAGPSSNGRVYLHIWQTFDPDYIKIYMKKIRYFCENL